MSNGKWVVGQVAYAERMPPLPQDGLDEKQRSPASANSSC